MPVLATSLATMPTEAILRLAAVRVRLPDGRAETAWTYVFKPEYAHRLAAGAWDFAHFLRHGKARFEARYLGFTRI